MGTILKVLVAIPAILFTVFGLRWAVDPGKPLPVLHVAACAGCLCLIGAGRQGQSKSVVGELRYDRNPYREA